MYMFCVSEILAILMQNMFGATESIVFQLPV